MPVIIRKYQSDQVERAVSPVAVRASQTSLGELGQGISDVSGMFDNWQDEIDTADAKAADSAYSDLIRQELYADETGFMYSQGGDAVNRRGSVTERLEAEQQRILGDLSPSARNYATSAMEARRQRALQTVDQYTAVQRRNYLNTASEARLVSTVQDAIFNPDLVAQSIATADQELSDLAAREGWAPDVLALKRQEARTEIHSGIIGRLEAADPIRALEYLRNNRSQMAGSEVSRLEGILVPRVREHRGRQAGAAAALGQVDSSKFDWSRIAVGGAAARSDSFTGLDPKFASRVASMVTAAEADGVKLTITSAYRSNKLQARLFADAVAKYGSKAAARKWVAPPGSSKHNTGTAVDFGAAGGGLLRDANSREAKWLQQNAERFGLHLPMSWEPWQVEMAGSRGGADIEPTAMRPSGIESLLEISDPDERAAAINEYNLRTGAARAQAEAQRQAAEDAASQMIEAGGNINDLPLKYRQFIGREAMSSLRIYNERIASGPPIVTDDATYVQLSEMMALDPDAFMAADPITWLDKLDKKDHKYFVKQRSDMLAGRRNAGSDAPSVSALRTAAKTALSAAGLDGDDAAKASFETSLLRWSAAASADGTPPLPSEINDRINQMLVPIVIDPIGFGNKQDGRLFQMDYDGSALDPNDDLTPDMLRDGSLWINDVPVSSEMIELFANGFNDRVGHAPTVQELVEGIIATGLYE